MMKTILPLLFLGLVIPLLGQKQGNIWYFGEGAGLDFNGGDPVPITGGQIFGNPMGMGEFLYSEGSAVISDSEGQLLFYSNGENVWNRNNEVMPNGGGLLGMYSSTTAAFIVPAPLSDSLFYVFTTDGLERNLRNGLRYSLVDMCRDNGLGDVIPSRKNVLLLDRVAEKITAVNHPNGKDIWLVTHEFNTNAFYSYRISELGINPPVITTIGSIHTGNGFFSAIGQMKASPNGDKIALVFSNVNPSVAELFDFDPLTGRLSNWISLTTSNLGEYGLDFSPDNTKIYITSLSGVHQFDITAGGGTQGAINATRINVGTGGACLPRGIQLGPNGKIYLKGCGNTGLSVIENPNEAGLNCGFRNNAVNVQSNVSFPFFIHGYRYRNGQVACLLPETNVTACSDGLDNDGDGLTDCEDPDCIYSTAETIRICEGESYEGYLATGFYQDTFIAQTGCDSIRTLDLTVEALTVFNEAISICADESYAGYSTAGFYLDTFTRAQGCDSVRILDLTVLPLPVFSVAISICGNEDYAGYTTTGLYVDTLAVTQGCDSIRVLDLLVEELPVFSEERRICAGESYVGYTATGLYVDTLAVTQGCDSIRVLDLLVEELPVFTEERRICEGESYAGYTATGLYVDTLTAVLGCDSIRILDLTVQNQVLVEETVVLCPGESYEGYTTAGVYEDVFLGPNGCDSTRVLTLQEGTTIETFIMDTLCAGAVLAGYTQAGTYIDTLQSVAGCDSIRTLEVIEPSVYLPNVFSPNGDGINDDFRPYTGDSASAVRTFRIYDRWGGVVLELGENEGLSTADVFWDGTRRGRALNPGVYVYYLEVACQGTWIPLQGDVMLWR